MIRKNINGPSWLKLRGVHAENDHENLNNFVIFRVDNENAISPVSSQEIPPLSVLSLQTQKFRGRIGAISMRTIHKINNLKNSEINII
jgi:hypothetical protein